MKKAADLLPRFLERVADLPRTAPCVAGVSGGIDSVVLFDLLRRADFRKIIVAHFHHGLRGRHADRDAQFVRALAREAGASFAAGRGRTRTRAVQHRESLEEAARRLRRTFLARTAKKHAAGTVFLGHHAGDAAETMLFHLARGGGPRGLSSLRPQAPLDDTGIIIIRPLLGFTRGEIESHAKARQLTFCEDETNTSRAHTRNRLRHDVLPALAEAVGFDPVPALARAADLLAEEDAALDALVRDRATSLPLETRHLRAEPVALQRRWLRIWLRRCTGIECDYDTIERARALALSTRAPAKMNLPCGHNLRRRAGKLFVERARPQK
ncbi:MAG: tRNA lysidine(34) synthetase TilS [Chthoniobacterales bacterium]